jgi:hypothetical protein
MAVKLETVTKLADALPGAVVGTRWGNRTWMVGGHGFAWQRPLTKADVKRYGDEPPPSGDLFAVIVDGLDGKDAILAMDLPGFFTIPHFDGYAAVLVELRLARLADVRAALVAAHRVAAARKPKAPKETKPSKRRGVAR